MRVCVSVRLPACLPICLLRACYLTRWRVTLTGAERPLISQSLINPSPRESLSHSVDSSPVRLSSFDASFLLVLISSVYTFYSLFAPCANSHERSLAPRLPFSRVCVCECASCVHVRSHATIRRRKRFLVFVLYVEKG